MARAEKRRRFRGPAEIKRLLRDLESSGQTQRAFAESRGIPLSTLSLWLRKKRSAAAPRLIPVELTAARRSPEPFEVWLRGGRVIRVPADFDPEVLRRLLETIESC